MMWLRPTPIRRGMTLIEIMLAVAILATIVALTWGSLSTSFRLRRASLDKFDRYRALQTSLDRMAREISMAFVTNIGVEATNDQNEITYQTIFTGDEDELTFTSLAHVRTRPDAVASEQCEISYRLERRRGEDGRMVQHLIRREDAPIDDDPEEGGITYVLIHDVRDVTFEYWDGDREIAGDAWVRSWDAIGDKDGTLPDRVRITIEVPHPTLENETLEFSTQTQIVLTRPLVVIPPDIVEEQQARMQAVQEALEQEGFTDDSLMDEQDQLDFYDSLDQQGGQ